jgi:hypothetical protein
MRAWPIVVAIALLALGAISAACDEQDPFGDRRNVVDRNPRADGGDDTIQARELFKALEPQFQEVCGKQCHADGTFGGNPPRFLAGPDAYVTIKTFSGFITKSVFESKLLTRGAHAGPALEGANEELRKKIVEWLDVEASILVERASVTTQVLDLVAGANVVDLGALAPTVAGAKLSFDASLGPAFLTLSNMRVRGGDTTAVRIVHPIFRLVRGGTEYPDPVDSFSNLDDKYPQAVERPLGPGQLFLTEWKEGDKLRITFETIEATTIPVIVDDTPKPCKALQAFIDNAKPQLQGNGCLDCHGEGGNGQAVMNLVELDQDDALACQEVLKEVNLANKAASLIIDKPAGAVGHTGGKVGDPAGYTAAIRAWIDNE